MYARYSFVIKRRYVSVYLAKNWVARSFGCVNTLVVALMVSVPNRRMLQVIRGLATGRYTADAACAFRVMRGQAMVGVLLGTALSAGGFVRVLVTEGTDIRCPVWNYCV